ncbi:hypothetical protein LY11_04374 [Pedobacter cryoconitis]|uniref:Uncharacterized protein n=1 Tax=Pedobacter cryoconitis TaxID=188932 RepID=A0A327SAG5_9SPHI|nr:hypothetical protein LY11_04374 [Pedobacter cryoconitis]
MYKINIYKFCYNPNLRTKKIPANKGFARIIKYCYKFYSQ